jgi:triosephosphate isomerase
MSSFLILANFKSHKTASEVESWLQAVAPVAATSGAEVVVAPSFPYLLTVSKYSLSTFHFQLASQDVSPFPPGAYTGAVSAQQLKSLGAQYCLVGHSERRRYFHETSSEVANKVHELLGVGITPVVCLAKEDLAGQFAALPDSHLSRCHFVYEPPADIGGTEAAPLSDIRLVTDRIRTLANAPVLYGGSVHAGNLSELLSLDLQGVLVSTASLQAEDFIAVLNSYQTHGS